jgi:two-component system, OmpR family, sensor kinase
MTSEEERVPTSGAKLRAMPASADTRRPGRLRRTLSSLRLSLVLYVVGLLALTVLVTVIAIRAVLVERIDERIERELVQEVEELRALAVGNDPVTGEPFADDVERILEVFFRRNIPLRNEVMLGLVDGEVVTAGGDLSLLAEDDQLPAFIDQWGAVDEAVRDQVETTAGPLEYLTIPLADATGETAATFVVAVFADRVREEVADVVDVAALIGVIAVLVGSSLAIGLAGRILRPIRALSTTATRISERDLSDRIEVQGNDEIAQLGVVVNTMLDHLEEAFASQRAFLDDTGHELRTPLTIIRGQLEVMGDDPGEWAEVKPLVLDEVQRMQRLVEDLILLAKASRPDFLRRADVHVGELTTEVHRKASALDAGITWRLGQTADAAVDGDRNRLTQALIQLAQNASVHCPPGSTVTIASSAGEDIRLWVADDGPGIPQAEQDRLFERFHRGSLARTQSEGTGLGLAIVKAIADAHGGRLAVDSDTGRGARFTIVLPLTARTSDGHAPAATTLAADLTERPA